MRAATVILDQLQQAVAEFELEFVELEGFGIGCSACSALAASGARRTRCAGHTRYAPGPLEGGQFGGLGLTGFLGAAGEEGAVGGAPGQGEEGDDRHAGQQGHEGHDREDMPSARG